MQISLADLKKTTGVGFGTSGIRAKITDLTDQVAYIYTTAFLAYLEKIGDITIKSVAIAGDLRLSTPHLIKVVSKAIVDRGYKPIFCGFIPTPALSLYGFTRKIPTIMVTGSHIPKNRNGIKFNKPDGEILKKDEKAISAMKVEIDQTKISSVAKLPPIDTTAKDEYIKRYLDFFDKNLLKKLKIGLYGHSAVGRDIIYTVLKSLGANVIKIGYSSSFVSLDTENVSQKIKRLGLLWEKKYDLDIVVSTDGDSDRPLILGESGHLIRSDILGIPTAIYLGAKTVVTAISCNTAVDLSNFFAKIIKTKVGSPYVVEAMQSLVKKGYKSVVGYEANGGFLIASPIRKNKKVLPPLPTRDALIVILCCLAQGLANNQTVSQLFDSLPMRFTSSGSLKINAFLKETDINKLFKGNKIKTINHLDGLRITFTNGDIIHFRPSQNSPEFRYYTESNTPQKAQKLSLLARTIIKSQAKI